MNWSISRKRFRTALWIRRVRKNQTNLTCLTFPEKFYSAKFIRTEMGLFSNAWDIRLSNFVCDLIVGEMIRKLITRLMNNLMACSGWCGLSIYENCTNNSYGLLTKFVRSRWLDIGQVPFLRVYGPRSRSINSQKKTRPISSHLDRTNLVNKGFIIWL